MLVAVVIMRSSCRLTNCDVSDGVKPDHSRTCCVVLDRARYSTGPTAAANESTHPKPTTHPRPPRGGERSAAARAHEGPPRAAEAAHVFEHLVGALEQLGTGFVEALAGERDLGRSRAAVEQVGAELA